MVEQNLNYGIFFDLNAIHHETFAIASFTLTIGILIGSKLLKKSEKQILGQIPKDSS